MANSPELKVEINPYHPERSFILAKQMMLGWMSPFYPRYLLLALPLKFIIFLTVTFTLNIVWAIVITYWFKPVFERIALFALGRLLFGQPFNLKDWWRHSLQSVFKLRTLADLTYGRLLPYRGYKQCIELLENKQGKGLKNRFRSLGTMGSWHVWCHGIILLIVPIFFSLTILDLIRSSFLNSYALPHENIERVSALIEEVLINPDFFWVLFAAGIGWLIFDTFFEVWHTACCFAQYLINRTRTEGWHIERYWRAHQQAKRKRIFLSLILLGSFLMLSPLEGEAKTFTETAHQSKQQIQTIVEGKDYGYIEYRDIQENQPKEKNIEPPKTENAPYFSDLSTTQLIIFILILLGIAGSILIYFYRKNLLTIHKRLISRKPPDTVAGFSINPQSLPTDIPNEIQILLDAGKYREILSLLIRSSLRELMQQADIPFLKGDTERDCIHRVQNSPLPEEYQVFFTQLMERWQWLAYAHRPISEEVMKTFIQQWGVLYEPQKLKKALEQSSNEENIR